MHRQRVDLSPCRRIEVAVGTSCYTEAVAADTEVAAGTEAAVDIAVAEVGNVVVGVEAESTGRCCDRIVVALDIGKKRWNCRKERGSLWKELNRTLGSFPFFY